jgi:hypothetical protein
MTRKPLAPLVLPLLVALVGFLAAAWAITRSGADDRDVAPVTPDESGAGVAQPADMRLADEPAPNGPTAATDGEQEPGSARSEVASEEETRPAAEPPPGEGVLVQVVRATDDEPVAGAEVYAPTRDMLLEEDVMALFAGELDLDALLTRGVRMHRTNEAGLTRVPAPSDGTLLRGRKGELAGMCELEQGMEEPIRLELLPKPTFLVKVEHPDGTPAPRIPLDLRAEDMTVLRVFTGADGIADLAPALEVSRSFLEFYEDTLEVVAGLPLDERLAAEVDPEEPPDEPILLTLPATGVIRVVLEGVDADGPRPIVRMTALEGEPHPADIAPSPDPTDGWTALGTAGEPVDLRVGLGKRHLVIAWQRNPAEFPYAFVDGPRRAGEVVEVRVDVGHAEPLARMRVVHEVDGKAVPAAQLQARSLADTEYGAVVELPRPLPREPFELGDVAIGPPPVLVTGRVVDAEGNPVPRAGVSLRYDRPGTRSAWLRSKPARSDGTFELRGHAQADQLVLRASRSTRDVPGEPVAANVGDRDVELVVPAVATVWFHLRAEEEVRKVIRELRLPTLVSPTSKSYQRPRLTIVDEEGAEPVFRFRNVPLGDYVLALPLPGSDERLVLDEHVRLTTTGEVELGPFDLRGRLFAHSVTVVDPDGRRVGRAALTVKATGTTEFAQVERYVQDGRLDLVSTAPRVDVRATADGFGAGLALNVAGDVEVRLTPPTTVHVEVPANAIPDHDDVAFLIVVVSSTGRSLGTHLMDQSGATSIVVEGLDAGSQIGLRAALKAPPVGREVSEHERAARRRPPVQVVLGSFETLAFEHGMTELSVKLPATRASMDQAVEALMRSDD